MGQSSSDLQRLSENHLLERSHAHTSFSPPPSGLSQAQEAQIASSTVTELLRLMGAGTYTSEQITKVFISRSHAVGWALGGVTEEGYEQALAAAKQWDARRAAGAELPPLAGIPVSIKEHVAEKGKLTSCGQKAKLRLGRATEDAVAVAALKAAGAIPFVRSNVPQLLMLPEGSNNIYPAACNPYDASRSPGGSSAGEGVLIASRASCLGLGTDIGGSIRLPSAMCGIYGLKPTPGRVPSKGVAVPFKPGYSGQILIPATAGPMGRCVDDLALMMRAFATETSWSADHGMPRVPFDGGVYYHGLRYGENPTAAAAGAGASPSAGAAAGTGAAATASAPVAATTAGTAGRKLKIGVFRRDRFFEPAAACQRGVTEAAEALKAAGHEVVEWSPLEDGLDTYQCALNYYAAMAADGNFRMWYDALEGEPLIAPYKKLAAIAQLPNFIRPVLAFVLRTLGKPRMADLLLSARGRSAEELMGVHVACQRDRAAFFKSLEKRGIDLVLCPGLGLPAFPHGSSADLTTACSWTFLWNYLNVPAGTVPVTFVREDEASYTPPEGQRDDFGAAAVAAMRGSEGLPVGVQLVGLPHTDEVVLRGMKELETALKAKEAARNVTVASASASPLTRKDLAAGMWPASAAWCPDSIVAKSVQEAAVHQRR